MKQGIAETARGKDRREREKCSEKGWDYGAPRGWPAKVSRRVGVNCGKLGRVPSLFIKRRGAARRDQQQNNIALRNVKPGN